MCTITCIPPPYIDTATRHYPAQPQKVSSSGRTAPDSTKNESKMLQNLVQKSQGLVSPPAFAASLACMSSYVKGLSDQQVSS